MASKMKDTIGHDITMKLVLVGDGSVGKTSMLISYTTDKFPTDYVPTVFDNYVASIRHQGQLVKLWLWDSAGQDQYKRLRPLSYPKTDIFLVCFSLMDARSFKNALNKWLPEISEHCPNAIKIFVGTKSDLRIEHEATVKQLKIKQKNLLPVSMMEKKINSLGYRFMRCSALDQTGLNDVFHVAITSVKQNNPKFRKSESNCNMI